MRKFIVIVLLFLWPVTAYTQESSITSINFKWFLSNQELINQKIKSGSEFEVIPIINTLCTIWKFRNGAIGAEISPSIAIAIIYQPNIVLSWFEKDKVEFNAWVSRLSSNLFTDYRGNQKEKIENRRREMITALQKYSSSGGNEQHRLMAKQLIEVLEKANIREIKYSR